MTDSDSKIDWNEDGWWTKWKGDDVKLTVDERVASCSKVGIGGEITKPEELKPLFQRKVHPDHPVAYDGFEPSGRMHIAQGLLRSMNVNYLTQGGVKFVFWVADYFALMNLKLGGDIKKIQDCGKYMIEVWKACGMDLTNVEFVWASEFIHAYHENYWFNVLQVAMKNNIRRVKRCGMIMGREASDQLMTSQLFYPCMQCNDVFQLRCDITSLGMDQRKVNMLAREYCDTQDTTGLLKYLGTNKKGKRYKPVILSHHMLAGLTGVKMSKSDPDSAIFMEDTAKDVTRKVRKAWCPPGVLTETRIQKNGEGKDVEVVYTNGCMEYLKYIVFPKSGHLDVKFKDPSKEAKRYTDYESLEADFLSGALHPGDLKPALSSALNLLLDPVRAHFRNDPNAKALLGKIKRYMAERAAAKNASKKGNKGKGNKGNKGKKGAPKGPPPVFDLEDDAVIGCLDIRVGSIGNARLHETADGLYVSTITIGDGETRTVCSKMRDYIPLEDFKGPCLVMCNMKARKMMGVKSEAMVLGVSSADGKSAELLVPPPDAKVGTRVTFEGIASCGLATANQLNKGKGKAALAGILADPTFCINGSLKATFRGSVMMVNGKEVTVKSLANCKIK